MQNIQFGESICICMYEQESAQFRGRSLLQHVDHGGGVQQMLGFGPPVDQPNYLWNSQAVSRSPFCAIWHARTKSHKYCYDMRAIMYNVSFILYSIICRCCLPWNSCSYRHMYIHIIIYLCIFICMMYVSNTMIWAAQGPSLNTRSWWILSGTTDLQACGPVVPYEV